MSATYFRFKSLGACGTAAAIPTEGGFDGRAAPDGEPRYRPTWHSLTHPTAEAAARYAAGMLTGVLATIPGAWGSGSPAAAELRPQREKLGPGERFKRAWRPHTQDGTEPDPKSLTDSCVAVENLDRRSAEIFRVIEPGSPSTDKSYGHSIRELLMLACMEAENSWLQVLRENSYSHQGAYSKTADYVKLADPLRLRKWSVRLPDYPTIGTLTPYLGWNSSKPTKSLPWYDAYNKVKHDRASNFAEGTLRMAIGALSACWVVLVAQYGPDILKRSALFVLGAGQPFDFDEGYLAALDGEPTKMREMTL